MQPVWGPTGWEPVDPQQSQAGWTAGILTAGNESAVLNAHAALWTGAAVALTVVQSIAGILVTGIP